MRNGIILFHRRAGHSKITTWLYNLSLCYWAILYFALFLPSIVCADVDRRAQPMPFDPIFPNAEYIGPLIGAPNTDPLYPLTQKLWEKNPWLKKNNLRLYGWINPSFNLSTSNNSNIPLSYTIVPNHIELEQAVLRFERPLDSVQMEQMDWGFRISNVYGIDYRYTLSQGIFSAQLFERNQLYGYDPVECYSQLYMPSVAEGMVITLGRYISPPDIEAQLAPQNALLTHSLMFTYDAFTQTGINTSIQWNRQWTSFFGFNAGNDTAPWAAGAHPTYQALVRWVAEDNNNSIYTGITTWNGEEFKGNHDNLQEFNFTWTHRISETFFTSTEFYWLYQHNAALGGSCNFGPIQSFGGGGGCGPIIPGLSDAFGAVNYTEIKVSEHQFITLRSDYLDDFQGQRTGYATGYFSVTIGLNHAFSELFIARPEFRVEHALSANAYDNGKKNTQITAAIDAILRI
jgi:hypothetical protein